MERITFVSRISGEMYTGFVLKRKRGQIKFGRTAGLTWVGRLQNIIVGYWYNTTDMNTIENLENWTTREEPKNPIFHDSAGTIV